MNPRGNQEEYQADRYRKRAISLIPRHLVEIPAIYFCTRGNCAEKYLYMSIVALTDLIKMEQKITFGAWFFKLLCSCFITGVFESPSHSSLDLCWEGTVLRLQVHNARLLKYATRSAGQSIPEIIMIKVLKSILQHLINMYEKHSFWSLRAHILGKTWMHFF